MPEGLSGSEVGKEIAEHATHAAEDHDDHHRRARWVTISEAASILKINPVTAWQWTRQPGRLPVVRRRGIQLVRFSDVLKLAEERGLLPALPKGRFLTA